MVFFESQIQFLLLWCSKAFMLYLRNLTCLFNAPNAAFDKAAAMPHFYYADIVRFFPDTSVVHAIMS
jgi:hypothetical protein